MRRRTGKTTAARSLPGQLRQGRRGVGVLPTPATPNQRPIQDPLGLERRQVAGIHAPLANPHGLATIGAGVASIRGRDADVESGEPTWRSCRCEDIGRAQARGSFKQAKDFRLGGGIRQANEIKDVVPNVIVTAGALARRATERVRAARVKSAPADAATQRLGGEASTQAQAHCRDVGVRLHTFRLRGVQSPRPLRADSGIT